MLSLRDKVGSLDIQGKLWVELLLLSLEISQLRCFGLSSREPPWMDGWIDGRTDGWMGNYCTLKPEKHAAFHSIPQLFSSQPESVLWFCWGLHWTDLYLCKLHLIRAGQVLSVKTSVSKQYTVFTDTTSYLTFIWILIGQMEWDAFGWVMLDLNWAFFGFTALIQWPVMRLYLHPVVLLLNLNLEICAFSVYPVNKAPRLSSMCEFVFQ